MSKERNGYSNVSLTEPSTITAEEVISVRKAVGWAENTNPDAWLKCLNTSIVSGLRNEEGELIGVGFAAYNPRHAVLCDFCIEPNYQGRDLSKIIIEDILSQLKDEGVLYLYTSLADPEKFGQMLTEYGFSNTGYFAELK